MIRKRKHDIQYSQRYITTMLCLFFLLAFCECKKKFVSDENSNSSVIYLKGSTSDLVTRVERTNDGGFIYCGFTLLDSTNTQAFLLKVNADGKQEWYKTYGGKNYDEFRHVIQCSDGGFLAVGRSNSIGQSVKDTNVSFNDFVLKTDAMGNEEWSKSYSTNSRFNIALNAVTDEEP